MDIKKSEYVTPILTSTSVISQVKILRSRAPNSRPSMALKKDTESHFFLSPINDNNNKIDLRNSTSANPFSKVAGNKFIEEKTLISPRVNREKKFRF